MCESCTRGQYAPNELSLRCDKCPQGWSINATDSPSCLHCAEGSQSYPSRPPGSIDNGPSGGTSCVGCELGWIQTPQTRTCWMCYTGFYSLYRGEELPTEFATDKVGYEDNALCHLCPTGAECLGGHRVKALNSWWRSSNMSVSLTQCFEHAACLGARNTNGNVNLDKAAAEKENNETCAVGYRGRLCHQCDVGFGRETFDSCMKCPPAESNVALMGVGICAVLSVLVLFVIFTVRTGNEEETSASMMFKTMAAYGQVVGIASLFPYRWPKSVLVLFDTLEMMTSVSDRFLNTDCALDDENRAIPLTYEKAIMYMTGPVGFIAGATLFWGVVHCVMRCRFKKTSAEKEKEKIRRHESIANLNRSKSYHSTANLHRSKSLVSVVSQATSTSGSTKTTVAGASKKHSNFFQAAPTAPVKRSASSSSQEKVATAGSSGAFDWQWRHTKRYLVVSIIVTMVILHPTLTRQSLFLFMCTEIEKKFYLRKDVQLQCFTSQHYIFAMCVGLPGVLLYVVGTPAFTLWILYRRRHKLNVTGLAGQETKGTYGFLYRGYEIYYWETVIMSRKIAMVIVAVFGLQASVETQALLALLVVVLASAAHVIVKPFSGKFAVLDKLERAGLVTAFITLCE